MTIDEKFDKLAGMCIRNTECHERAIAGSTFCWDLSTMTNQDIEQAFDKCFTEDATHDATCMRKCTNCIYRDVNKDEYPEAYCKAGLSEDDPLFQGDGCSYTNKQLQIKYKRCKEYREQTYENWVSYQPEDFLRPAGYQREMDTGYNLNTLAGNISYVPFAITLS